MAPDQHKIYNLLLVDDDPDEVGLFCAGMRQLNIPFEIVYAKNHDELFHSLEKPVDFDLIILDISMPGKDGIDCLKQLKKHAVYSSIPVIVFTVAKDTETTESAHAAGAHYYVVKPYSQRNYLETLEQIFAIDWKSKPPTPDKNHFLINYAFA